MEKLGAIIVELGFVTDFTLEIIRNHVFSRVIEPTDVMSQRIDGRAYFEGFADGKGR